MGQVRVGGKEETFDCSDEGAWQFCHDFSLGPFGRDIERGPSPQTAEGTTKRAPPLANKMVTHPSR